MKRCAQRQETLTCRTAELSESGLVVSFLMPSVVATSARSRHDAQSNAPFTPRAGTIFLVVGHQAEA